MIIPSLPMYCLSDRKLILISRHRFYIKTKGFTDVRDKPEHL